MLDYSYEYSFIIILGIVSFCPEKKLQQENYSCMVMHKSVAGKKSRVTFFLWYT